MVATTALASACSELGSGESELIDNDPHVLDEMGHPLRLVSGPTPKGASNFTALKIVPGEEFWSGMAIIEVSNDRSVIIEEATVMVTPGIEGVGVYLGRPGIDGLTGATSHMAPGRDEPKYASMPPLPKAAGMVLKPGGPQMVVYAVAKLSQGSRRGGIYGSQLRIRAGDKVATVLVLSPTMLCAGDVPPIYSDRAATDPCYRFQEKFISKIEGM